jgi:acetoacetyl-CoA synthetase
MNSCLWTPTLDRIRTSNLLRFCQTLPNRFDPTRAEGYADLHRYSIERPSEFWNHIWHHCGIIGDTGTISLERGEHFLDTHWYPHGTLNFAENLLRPATADERIAIVEWTERGTRRMITRRQLLKQATAFAMFLTEQGIQAGDRVAALLPNVMEAVVAMLGTAAIGAIWSSCSPDFGDDAIVDRFRQITPKVLIGCSHTSYSGKRVAVRDKLAAIRPRLASASTVIGIGIDDDPTIIPWSKTVQSVPPDYAFAAHPFAIPLFILYSSGTTGAPKCIVHGAGGTLLQHLKEHQLHSDIQSGDVVFFYTTTGWMMWNWLVTVLASEAAIVLYDGSPFTPDAESLWRIARTEGITHFGAGAKYYAFLEKSGVIPSSEELSPMRVIFSTGSPLLPESFDYLYRDVKPDMNVASISGGTDIISCFALGCPTLPVHRGELQVKGLGMDVMILNEAGNRVVGEPGELVCASPFPSMPVGFWNDLHREKYLDSYFRTFENLWCHGDWAEETASGGLVIHGRSDATLNPGGVRIGTAEIYQHVESFEPVAETLATVYRRDGDEQIVLFIRLKPGFELTAELKRNIRNRLRERCSPRHVPRYILEAADFPRTISGKLSEIAVRNAISGLPIRNLAALANPECLDEFYKIAAFTTGEAN